MSIKSFKLPALVFSAFVCVFQVASVAMAVPVPPGTPILIVDGKIENGGPNTTVTPIVTGFLGAFDFGHVVGGLFSQITSGGTPLVGGSYVDFAIRDQNLGTVFSLTNSAPASVTSTLTGTEFSASQAEVPAGVPSYWNTLSMVWSVAGVPIHIDVANTGGSNSDGFAAVPLPPAVLLFGTGLIGLIGIARRRFF
ncbi:MAG TPA: hypothetical protein PKK23_09025 [Nitrospirales bacterium]|nr:hypothetical protein [Nitrospiraceae bacterium]HNP29172.1 hypothetical protein [Nitrospirales bacterium]